MLWTCAFSPLEESPLLKKSLEHMIHVAVKNAYSLHVHSYADNIVVSLQDHVDFCFVIYVWITFDYHKK